MVQTAERLADQTEPSLKRTPLYATHMELGARMVPFGGWEMPVQYPTGVLAEHQAVRERAGLFDIGHMGQVAFEGPDALEFLQWVTTHDVSRLEIGSAQYSLLCNESGGILDDIIVYRMAETRYFMIVNASNADADTAWIEAQLVHPGRGVNPDRVLVQRLSPRRTLLAIQGPRARAILRQVTPTDLGQLGYYQVTEATVDGVPTMIARTGYTGEIGFEISFEAMHAPQLWHSLLEAGAADQLIPCGLGARDTLRLEAGMALYGHELTVDTNPFEAGLGRVVHFEKGDFIGAEALKEVAERGPSRRLVGIELTQPGVLRPEYPILIDGKVAGALTSGGPSPTLKKSIGMGYVPAENAAEGTELAVEIRGRPNSAKVVHVPFYRRAKR